MALSLSMMRAGGRKGLAALAGQQALRATAASTFAKVPLGPPDPIFGLTDAFNKVRCTKMWACCSLVF